MDLSGISPGQRVACPHCGSEFATHQKPARPPPAPPRAKRAATTPRRSRAAPRRAHAPRVHRSLASHGLWIGVGALVLVGVLAVVLLNKGGGDQTGGEPGRQTSAAARDPGNLPRSESTGGTPTPKEPDAAEVVREFARQYERSPVKTRGDFLAARERLSGLGAPADAMLRRVTRDYVSGPGSDDVEARSYLGDLLFDEEVPEAIAFRDYPYIRAVESAATKRWFPASEKALYDQAMEAWQKVLDHARRLEHDRRFRVADQVRANVSRDPFFRDYRFAVKWADPYLIFYSSKHQLSTYDLLVLPTEDERDAARAEIEARKKTFVPILEEKAAIFTGVYKEFMRRYEERMKLKPLMDAWGGRPDYKPGTRRFPDGRPMVVWIFSDREAYDAYHTKISRKEMSRFGGYFSAKTGWVYLFDEKEKAKRQVEISKNVHEAVHQLLYWFTRQRKQWRPPTPDQNFFEEGFAEWMGSVRLMPDRTLSFEDVNPGRLMGIQARAKRFAEGGSTYPVIPLEKLTTFETYADVVKWCKEHLGMPGPQAERLYYEQAWALVYFLEHAHEGKRREQFLSFLDAYLTDQVDYSGEGINLRAEYFRRGRAFRDAFGLKTNEDWAALNEQFRAFIFDTLLPMEVKPYIYTPPDRSSR